MRTTLIAVVAALACAAAFAPASGATNECHGIMSCISVPGPWVLVPAHGTTDFLLTCPKSRGIVGGLDAQATSSDVRVDFVGRIGAPVQPGVTTTTSALFRAVSTSGRAQAFKPLLGCIPVQGGGGRSTVSARVVVPAGPSLIMRSHIVVIGPGQVKFAHVACEADEKLVGSWHAVAFRVKQPPALSTGALVTVTPVIVGKKVVVTAAATDGLSIDVHAIVQVGAECAP